MPPGRPRSASNRDLPPRLRRRQRARAVYFYYRHADGTEEPLGTDYAHALERWKELETTPLATGTSFASIAAAFEREYVPSRKPKTQREYALGLKRLVRVFGEAPIATIKPGAVGQLKRTLRDVPVQFDRLRALLSTLWNWAREAGLTEAPNPCIGVRGYGRSQRDVYVSSDMFFAVYDRAEPALRDWMDLSVLLAPRVVDVLRLTRSQIRDGALEVGHSKRSKVTRLPIDADLQTVLERVLARARERSEARKVSSVYLVQDEEGQPLTYWRLRAMFDRARAAVRKEAEEAQDAGLAALADWQMRDLRPKSATDADSLEEAQNRLGHDDPATTRRVYQRIIKAKAGRLPRR
ncbi:MAG: phage integrase Arm DNA-binding domain-containing protein [Planctomycetes bacterium]|nr:phage integrase Arm DNA-binding domain-containing protein [Planctomycetota bacterium]